MMKTALLSLTIFTVTAASAGVAHSQAEIVPEEKIKGVEDADIEGWNPSLAVNGTLNLVSNTNVVGQVEGLSMLFGLGLAGGADYIKGKSIIRNELTISESFAKTPVVDKFIKTDDKVAVSTTYNYFVTKFLGGFARVKAETALFKSSAVTADQQTYIVNSAAPGGGTRTVNSSNLQVAPSFKPFTLTESIGVFAEPIRKKKLNLSLRGGLGGRHTIASGVLVENDDALTPEIELQELANVHQAGVELFAGISGKAKQDRLTYGLGGSILVPFINNDDYNRSATDLTRLAIEGSATIAVFDWMGLVYKGSIIIDPQLFPNNQELTQYQTSLLLTFNYTLIDREKGIKALKAEAAAAAAAKDKAETEKKIKEAEERNQELERQLKEAKEQKAEEEKADAEVTAAIQAISEAADKVCACTTSECATQEMGAVQNITEPSRKPNGEEMKVIQSSMARMTKCSEDLAAK